MYQHLAWLKPYKTMGCLPPIYQLVEFAGPTARPIGMIPQSHVVRSQSERGPSFVDPE